MMSALQCHIHLVLLKFKFQKNGIYQNSHQTLFKLLYHTNSTDIQYY